MDKKYLMVGVVVFVIAVVGGSYAYGTYAEGKYYENYRMAVFYGAKYTDLNNEIINLESKIKINSEDDIIKALINQIIDKSKEMKEYNSQYQYYVQEMLKYANSDFKRQYADSMLAQSNKQSEYLDNILEMYNLLLNTDYNDQTQVDNAKIKWNESVKRADGLLAEINSFGEEREKIRAQYPDFTKRLDQEQELAKNSTLL